jgi:hypothetical protein
MRNRSTINSLGNDIGYICPNVTVQTGCALALVVACSSPLAASAGRWPFNRVFESWTPQGVAYLVPGIRMESAAWAFLQRSPITDACAVDCGLITGVVFSPWDLDRIKRCHAPDIV